MLKQQEAVSFGHVVSVGAGRPMENGQIRDVNVKVGDAVLLPEYGGSKITLNKEDFFIYRDDDIVGILSEKIEE